MRNLYVTISLLVLTFLGSLSSLAMDEFLNLIDSANLDNLQSLNENFDFNNELTLGQKEKLSVLIEKLNHDIEQKKEILLIIKELFPQDDAGSIYPESLGNFFEFASISKEGIGALFLGLGACAFALEAVKKGWFDKIDSTYLSFVLEQVLISIN